MKAFAAFENIENWPGDAPGRHEVPLKMRVAEFLVLDAYEASIPTGPSIGRMWRNKLSVARAVPDPKDPKNYVGIQWRPVCFTDNPPVNHIRYLIQLHDFTRKELEARTSVQGDPNWVDTWEIYSSASRPR